jgi:hypothetical protein
LIPSEASKPAYPGTNRKLMSMIPKILAGVAEFIEQSTRYPMFQGSKPALFGMGMKLSIMKQNILAAAMKLVKQSTSDSVSVIMK